MGFQRWLPCEEDKYDHAPSEIAQIPIEKVTKAQLGEWIMDTTSYAEYARDNHYLNVNWQIARDLYNGDGWHQSKEAWRSRLVSNYCAELVRSRAAYITANNMTVYAYAVEKGDLNVAEDVRDIISNVFYINDLRGKDYAASIEAQVCGTCYYKAYWDDELSYPYGDVGIKVCDPMRIVTDWDIEEMQKGRFAGEIFWKTKEDIRRLWPGKMSGIEERYDTRKNVEYTYDETRQKGKYKVVELFVIDRSTEKVISYEEVQDPVTGEVSVVEIETSEPKYPNGRRVVCVEGVVVEDSPVAARLLSNGVRFPIVPAYGLRQPHEQYAKSIVIEYEPMVREIITREACISDILNLYAHPIPTFAKGQFDNPAQQAVSMPGTYWEYNHKNNVGAPGFTTPPAGIIGAGIQEVSMLTGQLQFLSGMNDVGLGNAPGSVQSGRGIIALQQRVDVRNSPMLMEHGKAITMLAKVVFAFVQSMYDTERVVRRQADRGQMEVKAIQPMASSDRLFDPNLPVYDIAFDVASAAPTNYVARSEQSQQWAQAGLMDPITAIMRSDIPNKAEAIRGAIAMSGNPLLVIHAVSSGHLSQDDPLVAMVLGQQQQQQNPGQESGGVPMSPSGVTSQSITPGEQQ